MLVGSQVHVLSYGFVWAAIACGVLCAMTGCAADEDANITVPADSDDQIQLLNERLHTLYHAYLNGDREQARASLHKEISLIEQAEVPPRVKARSLWLGYARLYVLAFDERNAGLSALYLLKAQYWCVREAEILGVSETEAAEVLKTFGPERMVEIVTQWDGKHTDGRGPAYAR